MKKIILTIIFIISILYCTDAQIKIHKTEVDYSLKIEKDSIARILTFWKDLDSTIYSSLKYSVSDFRQIKTDFYLKDEINTIQKLWEIAEDSINFNLRSFNIGYPLLYSDVLKTHIQAFIDSEEWQNFVKKNGKKLNYEIIKKVMLENNVYWPLNNFLKTQGYSTSGFETEKHGFVTKENLQKAGFSGSEIIPMPFIVWITLDNL